MEATSNTSSTPLTRPLKSCLKDSNSNCRSNATTTPLRSSASSTAATTITEASLCDDDKDFDDVNDDDDNDSGFPRRVCFDRIHIREYPQTLGVNPAVSEGAPLTLDWDHRNEYTVNVEMYEFTRIPVRRRSRKKLMISSQKRIQTLIDAGHSIEEIGEAIMAVQKCKIERLRSVEAFGWNGPLDFLSGAVETTMAAALRMRRRGSKILKGSLHSAMEGLGMKHLQPRRKSYSNPAC